MAQSNNNGLTQPFTVTDQQIQKFQEEGAICLRGVIDLDWIERLREATEKILKANPINNAADGDPGRFIGEILNLWAEDEVFREYVFEGPSAQIADALMGHSGVRLFGDQLFLKEPGTTTPTPWHQDQPYWPVLGQDICSVWVPMDKVTKESSGLEYVKGSHLWGCHFSPVNFGKGQFDVTAIADPSNEQIPDIDSERDKYEFLSWDMEPGDCLVHNSRTVHGAGGNKTNNMRRRAIATRWFGKEAFFQPNPVFTEELIGLKPGQPVESGFFPKVPRDPNEEIKTFNLATVMNDGK